MTREEDTPGTDSTAESQFLPSTGEDAVEEIVRDFMMDSANVIDDTSLQLPNNAAVNGIGPEYGGVASWDYGAEDPTRRPPSTDPWAVQQFLTPGATYDFGLSTSDETWSDISLSEFLKSPSPIPPVSTCP